MIRRAARSLLLSLGLLALASVTFACKAATPHRDCCPGEQHAPCDTHPGQVPSAPTVLTCCLAIPAPYSVAVEAASARTRNAIPPSGLPAFTSAPAVPVPIPDASLFDPIPLSAARRFTPDSEPIYLLTRRLRL